MKSVLKGHLKRGVHTIPFSFVPVQTFNFLQNKCIFVHWLISICTCLQKNPRGHCIKLQNVISVSGIWISDCHFIMPNFGISNHLKENSVIQRLFSALVVGNFRDSFCRYIITPVGGVVMLIFMSKSMTLNHTLNQFVQNSWVIQ